MFYCTACADTHDWPHTLFRSWGVCEVCGKTCACHDFPAAKLPPAAAEPVPEPVN